MLSSPQPLVQLERNIAAADSLAWYSDGSDIRLCFMGATLNSLGRAAFFSVASVTICGLTVCVFLLARGLLAVWLHLWGDMPE